MGKCEHGLTSKECLVCASPKHGAAEPVQEPVALETVYETIIHWDEGGGKRSRRELARRIVDLYTAPTQRPTAGATYSDVVSDGGMDPR